MDAVDRKLADALQRDATLSHEQLAQRVAASPSAVQRRVKRLHAEGVIEGIHAHLNPSALGRASFFIVALDIERKNRDLYEQLQRWIRNEDAIQQAYNVTGSSDFMLFVSEIGLEAYDRLMSRLVEDNPNVRKFTTSVVLQTFKRSMLFPVSQEAQDAEKLRSRS